MADVVDGGERGEVASGLVFAGDIGVDGQARSAGRADRDTSIDEAGPDRGPIRPVVAGEVTDTGPRLMSGD